MKRIIYYSDEKNEDFAVTVKRIKPLPKGYKYTESGAVSRFLGSVLYGAVVRPLAFLYTKIKFSHAVKHGTRLKGVEGCFIYANHTLVLGDAFIPSMLDFGRRNYILTGEQANSLTPLLPIMRSVGMIPLTKKLPEQVRLLRCIRERISEGASITVYPEEHVWPYYNGIREFDERAFIYPASLGAPVFALTNCCVGRNFLGFPKIVSYIDGPFYPDESLSKPERSKQLRDKVYEAMCARAESESSYSQYTYVRRSMPTEEKT